MLGYTICCMLYAICCQQYAGEMVFQKRNCFQSGRRVVYTQSVDLSAKWAPRVAHAEKCFVPKVGVAFCTRRQQKNSSAPSSLGRRRPLWGQQHQRPPSGTRGYWVYIQTGINKKDWTRSCFSIWFLCSSDWVVSDFHWISLMLTHFQLVLMNSMCSQLVSTFFPTDYLWF